MIAVLAVQPRPVLTVRRSYARVFDAIDRDFVQEDPDVPNDFAPNPDLNVVEVLDRAGTGLPFSKGLMATSVLATGLPRRLQPVGRPGQAKAE